LGPDIKIPAWWFRREKELDMNSLSRQKLHEESRVVKGLRIAGSYGKYALLSLITAAYLAACFKAFTIVRIAVIAMLPITILISLHIAVSEEVDR
jgi:hypothetical protein